MGAIAKGAEFLQLDRADYRPLGLSPDQSGWQALRQSYDDLPQDAYMPRGAAYRRRRFGRYRYRGATDAVEPAAQMPFYQSPAYNPLNGGIYRHFEPLAPEIQCHPTLLQLIRFHARLCRAADPETQDWQVYVHQIRIVGSPRRLSSPTPEGMHQDGHRYIAQILVARENVSGAETLIYDSTLTLMKRTTLTLPLDTLFINDRSAWHEVTPLRALAAVGQAYRDMLLIDFNPVA